MRHHDEDTYDKPFSLGAWLSMGRFFRPHAGVLVRIVILMIVSSFIDVLIPLYQKYIIDSFIVPRATDGIYRAAAIGVAVMFVQLVSTVSFTRLAIRVEMGFSRDLKKACFDHLQRLSLSYYNTTPVGYMIARVMSDTDKIGLLVAWGLVDVIWGLSYAAFAVVSMMILDARLGIWIVIMIPIMFFVTRRFQNRILKLNRRVRRTNAMITGSFNEGILGARTSKTLVIEDANSRDFDAIAEEMYRDTVRSATIGAVYSPVMMMFGAAAVALILVRGSSYVILAPWSSARSRPLYHTPWAFSSRSSTCPTPSPRSPRPRPT
jgi:ATP-binding cassette subfamily B protein